MEPVDSINKDVCGAKLLLTIVSAYPMDFVCFCDLSKTQHCCLSSNRKYNPPLATHPLPHPPTPLPPAHPLICTTRDIAMAVRKVAQNPAVLARWLK